VKANFDGFPFPGIVQHAQKHSSIALNTLGHALSLDPRNPLCKFHKASILFAVERYEEALEELLQLKQIVPKESLVYFLLGKVRFVFCCLKAPYLFFCTWM